MSDEVKTLATCSLLGLMHRMKNGLDDMSSVMSELRSPRKRFETVALDCAADDSPLYSSTSSGILLDACSARPHAAVSNAGTSQRDG